MRKIAHLLSITFVLLALFNSCTEKKNAESTEKVEEKVKKGNCGDAKSWVSDRVITNMKMEMIYGRYPDCEERPDGSFIITFNPNPSYLGQSSMTFRIGFDGKDYYEN
jgi:hypothetical protein